MIEGDFQPFQQGRQRIAVEMQRGADLADGLPIFGPERGEGEAEREGGEEAGKERAAVHGEGEVRSAVRRLAICSGVRTISARKQQHTASA